MPTGGDPAALRPFVDQLQQQMTTAGKPKAEVVVITSLALDDVAKASDQIQQLGESGATRVVHAWRYPDVAAFVRAADTVRRLHA